MTSLAKESAGSQRSQTAKTSTARVAIMNSGTEMMPTTSVLTTRS